MKPIGVIVVAALAMVGCASNPTPFAQNSAPPATSNLTQVSAEQQPVDQDSYPIPAYSDGYDSDQTLYAADAPPPLPEYDQPPCPGENYIWTPGTWSYQSTGYYWVPGVWVSAPFVGALWTPPYWAYEGSRYRWHRGFWGRQVGFYGGINYGFGYVGRGYEGGYWNNNVFAYNRAVTNVNTAVVHNVYDRRVASGGGSRVSYNGGRGGITARPIATEIAAVRDRPMAPAPIQREHVRQAAANREQFAAVNHGRPAVAAVATPLAAPRRETGQQMQRPAEPVRTPAPAQARQEPARPEVHQPRNDMRPVAPVQAQHGVPQRVEAQHQEARPVAPVRPTVVRPENHEQPRRPEAPAQHQQPQPAREERAAPQQHAAPPQQQHAAPPQQHAQPAARPAEHPAQPKQEAHPPQQHNEKPPERKPEEKKKF